jgi:tetratricopeptide (TPR) repeat protein
VGKTISNGDALFELGKLYCDRGDFDIAIEKLTEAAEVYFDLRQFNSFLKCQSLLLRMFGEREENEKINEAKERLQDIVIKEGFELNAKTYNTLGICASFKAQYDVALEYFQKSLAISLAADDKEDICYAVNGIAITYFNLGRFQDALKEVYNLQVFFQVLDVPELRLSTQFLNGAIFRKLNKIEQALEIFWDCYEILKVQKNMYMYIYLLFNMGLTYRAGGDLDLARMYLHLAKRSVDSKNLRYLSRKIDQTLEEMGLGGDSDYDLIFDATSNSVTEKKMGKIDFKNQFILLDLLHLFLRDPGAVYSKEALVKKIWKQDYNPVVHDNKIYVTIKRLRKMIEPDFDKPKYIFRAKNGYFLNKNTRVLLDH